MRRSLAAVTAALILPVLCAPGASAQPAPPPPYIDHVTWAKWGDLSSLRVYPTPAGRQAAGQVGTAAAAEQAWTEILTAAPEAALPGMREQFDCHWQFAELAQPGKTSWNLEPWRPEVPVEQMLATGCNPGGTEEPF